MGDMRAVFRYVCILYNGFALGEERFNILLR
jgi:hypothetical protein